MPDPTMEIWAVQDLLALIGCPVSNIRNAQTDFGRRETGIDVVFEIGGLRHGAQHTVYHSDEGRTSHPGSALRAEERKKFATVRVYGMWGYADWKPPFASRVLAKVSAATKYCPEELVTENWLLVSASLPHSGANASTLIYPELVSADVLNGLTHGILSTSSFAKAFLVLHLFKVAYGWSPIEGWRLLADHDGTDRRKHQAEMADLIFNRLRRRG